MWDERAHSAWCERWPKTAFPLRRLRMAPQGSDWGIVFPNNYILPPNHHSLKSLTIPPLIPPFTQGGLEERVPPLHKGARGEGSPFTQGGSRRGFPFTQGDLNRKWRYLTDIKKASRTACLLKILPYYIKLIKNFREASNVSPPYIAHSNPVVASSTRSVRNVAKEFI